MEHYLPFKLPFRSPEAQWREIPGFVGQERWSAPSDSTLFRGVSLCPTGWTWVGPALLSPEMLSSDCGMAFWLSTSDHAENRTRSCKFNRFQDSLERLVALKYYTVVSMHMNLKNSIRKKSVPLYWRCKGHWFLCLFGVDCDTGDRQFAVSILVAASPDLGAQVTPWSCVLSADSYVLYNLKHVRSDDMPLLIFTN